MESNFDDTRLFDYTDAELIKHITSLPHLHKFSNIVPLSSRYLAKGYAENELEDAVRASTSASQLGIHVPSIQRIVRGDDSLYCIMDRISGTTLDIAIIWILSDGKMQFRHTTPRDQKDTGRSFDLPQAGVLMRSFIVFTHHDLAPRNIILDHKNQLWLIDWDCAGFYPRFFEHAGMFNFIPSEWTKFALWRWNERRWLEIIRSRFTRFRTARRFNMKANGYAAAAARVDSDL
ncbi:hypothetical protein QL093DRAFT_2487609 [Fusarium oxysporum]|nr:hypothetical protein QL093DRAFT_2487609 [Fusarium oxysporum]